MYLRLFFFCSGVIVSSLFIIFVDADSVLLVIVYVFFFSVKTAYDMRISDWSSDVCSSDLPIAFALGLAAVGGLFLDMGPSVVEVLAETMFAGIANLAYVSIPMFVLMGAIVAGTPAGGDLYKALDRWLYKVPGGLVLSNIGACAIFAGMTGSSPATCEIGRAHV